MCIMMIDDQMDPETCRFSEFPYSTAVNVLLAALHSVHLQLWA